MKKNNTLKFFLSVFVILINSDLCAMKKRQHDGLIESSAKISSPKRPSPIGMSSYLPQLPPLSQEKPSKKKKVEKAPEQCSVTGESQPIPEPISNIATTKKAAEVSTPHGVNIKSMLEKDGIKVNKEIDAVDSKGNSILHQAALRKSVIFRLATILVDRAERDKDTLHDSNGSDLKRLLREYNNDGLLPLQVAIQNDNINTVRGIANLWPELLMEKTKNGKTCLQLSHSPTMVNLLNEYYKKQTAQLAKLASSCCPLDKSS